MTEEQLKLHKQAEERINALVDNFKQDIRGTLYKKLSDEEVKDFLISLWVDCTSEYERKIEKMKMANFKPGFHSHGSGVSSTNGKINPLGYFNIDE